ncbi:MAG: hypothetical protein QF565_15920, partial [Arenicellales bacterium]|nr:hypothetical protein [Arenicellales bacterium]
MNIQDAIAEIQQPRSRYQLIHFVLGQHDTPEMQFYQLMMELQDMGFKLRMAQLNVRKTEVEIARLLETGDELDAIEAEEKQVGLEQTQIVMKGAQREIA